MAQSNVKVVQSRAEPARSRPLWRRVLRTAREQRDRVLHPLRRRRARERAQALSAARSVLFVCHGNIYRSPFAAACFAGALSSLGQVGVRIGSAGFVGPNRQSPGDAQLLAREYGLDLSEHRSQLLNGSMVGEWDVIVVMSRQQAHLLASHFGVAPGRILVLGDFDPESSTGREIVDPWPAPGLLLKGSYARARRCTYALAEVAAPCWSSSD